jgi:TonB family protein
MLKRFVACLFALFSAASALAQRDTWVQVSTPSFLVVSNSDEQDARRVGRQFEQMRSVFQRVFPQSDLSTPTPIMVLAVADRANFEALEPEIYLQPGQIPIGGLFLPSPEQNYVLLWLNGPTRHLYAPIYHEYTHFVTSRTGEYMPLWLTEGLAQFYENTDVREDEVRLGMGSPELMAALQRNPLLPIATLVTVDQHSPYYHQEDKASMFYAESWGLTHYLKIKDAQEGTHRLIDYQELVRKNVGPLDAATQAFGDLTQLQADLHKYVMSENFSYIPMPGSSRVDESSFTVRALTATEADTIRAGFLAHDQRGNDARVLLEKVLRTDPDNAAAQATMGLVAMRQHRFEDAKKSCDRAVQLDAQSFFARYCSAVAVIQMGSPDPITAAKTEEQLRDGIKINPAFSLNYDTLAMLLLLRGKNLEEAEHAMRTAVQLDPGTVELRIDQAQVLMRIKKDKEAKEVLDLALKLSHTPEQTAAVENVMQSIRQYESERAKMGGKNLVGLQGSSTGAGVVEARAIYAPQPEYSAEARAAGREGTCVVSLIVGLDGKPSNIVVTRELGMGLDQKAVEAVSKWKFEPARRYGKPVLTHLTLSLQFKLFGVQTAKFFELSEKAKVGDHSAEFELANAFFEGRDIPRDENQGLALLQRAAQGGLPEAQFQLGQRIYGDGKDAQSYVDAYVWLALAQHGGIRKADDKIVELESRMTPDQYSEARKRFEAQSTISSK